LAELIHQAVHVHGMKVLVAAPSNVAVDNILERLVLSSSSQQSSRGNRKESKTRALRAVRLGHPARIKSSILSYSLEALVQNADGTEIVADVRSELQSFLRIMSNPRSRPNDKRIAYREIKSLRKEVRTREEKVVRELISSAQVVLTTTVGAANRVLGKVENGFDLVVIDEAAQALEASCWIPILRGRKVVLAGDHCQLPPTIKTKHHRAQVGLGKTMFERLLELYGDRRHTTNGTPRISRMLKVQYRMHQDIADWASKAMYGGELMTHKSVKSRTLSQLDSVHASSGDGAVSDLEETTLFLVDTAGCDMHETVNAAGSRFNQGEANIVNQHVRKLIGMGLQQSQLAIITPYNGQVELLRSMLLPDFPKLEIRSVDGFQGGERDAVVLSLVRSSERGGKDGIGFLRDDRRQNVAVTRAKRHLAVICDSETVSQSKFISTLISWIEEHGEQRSAIEYLSDSPNEQYEDDLRAAEMELLKMVDSSFAGPEKEKGPSSSQVSRSKVEDKKLDECKRKDLMNKISVFSENGSNKKEMVLSSELSSFDRRLVHEFAEQTGLGHRSEGVDGVDRRIILTIQKKEAVEESPITQATQTTQEVEEGTAKLLSAAPGVSPFSELAADDSDSDSNDEASNSIGTRESAKRDSIPSSNSLLADLARERNERQPQRETIKPPASSTTGKNKNKKKGQKLGGKKKAEPKEEKNLDHLDDMAFLDAQVENAQNAHGRKVAGSGKNYRTLVNGILNSGPEHHPTNTSARATASLKSKLEEAQKSRRGKTGKKKK
jgi:ATP-dependent RNA/DNA helicase IGHMBP2